MEAGATVLELGSGGGCGCKLPAAELLPLVTRLPRSDDDRLLVGSATADDAAVFRIADGLALVQTVDFFSSPVPDPYDFGRIAAANALSDVYAMGGTPLTALNIVAFPLGQLGGEALGRILRGGADVCLEAGVSVVGGHSIDDAEAKFGLAVTGVVDPARMVTNAGAQAGDVLVLTKPLGVGAIVLAYRRGRADAPALARAVAAMTTLNAAASAAAVAAGARAMTDVTGFGLLGHLHHLCRESGLAAELDAASLPVLDGARELLEAPDGMSGGSRRNATWTAGFTRFAAAVPDWRRRLLADATTSGGLLVAVSAARAGEVPGPVIGRLLLGSPGAIAVR